MLLCVKDLEQFSLSATSPQPAGSQRVYVRMQKRVRIVEQVEWEAEILPSAEPT